MRFDWLKTRQVTSGSYMAAYVVVMLAILAAVNYLAVQYNETFDATQSKLYSLSDQTVKVLRNLEKDAKIYYFDQKTRFDRAKDMLVRYENASPRVTVQYVDPDSQPDLAQAMNVRTYGTVMVEVGPHREEAKSTGEEDITNAIIRVVKGEAKTACLLSGHGEADPTDSERDGFAGAKQEIEGANYSTRTISLLESPQIPGDCTLLIIAGPSKDYEQPEIEILRNYVEQGGRVVFLLDYQKSPRLVELLGSWGVRVNNDVVVDLTGIGQLFGGGPLTPLVAQYETHPITAVMGNVATFFPMTRSVEPGESVAGWLVSKLFSTTAGSFATQDLKIENRELRRNADKETEGPISVGVAATHEVPEGAAAEKPAEGETSEPPAEGSAAQPEKKQARIVVLGTSLFARNNFLGRGGNLDLFLNILNWLSSDEDLISIRPKDPENTPLDISQSQMTRLFLGIVVGLPLVIVLAGVRVWWRRRD